MQETGNKKNWIIIGAIILVLGAVSYFYVARDPSSSDLLIEEVAVDRPVDTDLLATLSSLKRLRLDDSIFQNPAWMSFSDFSKVLESQPRGRQNPFAPFNSSTSTFSGF